MSLYSPCCVRSKLSAFLIRVLPPILSLVAVSANAFETDGCSAENVSEFGSYDVVYKLTLPDNANYDAGVPVYAIDNSATTGSFERVAYCMELDNGSGLQWAWVSLDAFTTDAGQIGVPVAATGAVFQQIVENMNVYTNVAGVTTGTDIATGNIEFWSDCYGTGNGLGLPGANGGLYDYDDTHNSISCFGSMQVHNHGAGQTVFAYNAWDSGENDGAGIGNSSGAHPDWTFAQNTPGYTVRRDLYVLTALPDGDGDGVDDDSDNCPETANTDQADNDEDGSGDVCDADDDNDEVADEADNCPLIANTDQHDNDEDGSGDVCDSDDDNDEVADEADNCPLTANTDQADNDEDGSGDVCDADDDNDEVADGVDNCPLIANTEQDDNDDDGSGDVCDADDDNDEVADEADNCPLTANTDQSDNDEDGSGDVCDADDDNDTVSDEADNCPLIANTDQSDNDEDGSGDVCDADDDNDEVADEADNCPLIANTDQVDTDENGAGDACDGDNDGDGVPDEDDAFPLDPHEWVDSDSDGVGDNGDVFPDDPNESADSDEDGVGDNADAFPNDPTETVDSDHDGVGDNSDVFPNDPDESADSDGDGVGDNADPFPNDPEASGRGADLQTSIAATPMPALVSEGVVLTLTIDNAGPDTASGSTLQAMINAPGMMLDYAGSDCSLSGNTGVVTLECVYSDQMPMGSTHSYDINVLAVTAGEFLVSAAVDSATMDDVQDNNATTESYMISEFIGSQPAQVLGDSIAEASAFGDIDGDGDLDLVVATGPGEPTELWLNDGTGTYVSGGTLDDAADSTDVVVADLDGDGDMDVVLVNAEGEPSATWLNDGSGVFSPYHSFGAGDSNAIAVTDVNGDGLPDYVVANDGVSEFYPGDGMGGVGDVQQLHEGAAESVVVSDIDGDGYPDLVFANADGDATVWFGSETGLSGPESIATGPASSVRLIDTNNDGIDDLVFSPMDSDPADSTSVSVWQYDASGGFEQTGALGLGDASDVGVADFDGDGIPDLIVVSDTGVHVVYLGDGSGGFDLHPVSVVSPGAEAVAIADIDGDGAMDVVFSSGYAGGSKVFRNTGSGNLAAVGEVDLEVQLSGPANAKVRIASTQTIVVTNRGDVPADAVVVEFDSGGLLRGEIATDRGNCNTSDGLVSCEIERLDAGQTARISVVVIPSAIGTYRVTAAASTAGYDRQDSNDSKSRQISATNVATGAGNGGGGGGGALGLLGLLLLTGLLGQRRCLSMR